MDLLKKITISFNLQSHLKNIKRNDKTQSYKRMIKNSIVEMPSEWQKSSVYLSNSSGCYLDGQWEQEQESVPTLQHVRQWGVEKLYLHHNERKGILRDIEHIHFQHLVVLRLWGNRIESVEGLPAMQLPSLQDLNLSHNNISSVRVARKLPCPGLVDLRVYGNYVHDEATLTQGHFPHLSFWSMQPQRTKDTFCTCPPFKLQARYIGLLNINRQQFSFHRSILPAYARLMCFDDE